MDTKIVPRIAIKPSQDGKVMSAKWNGPTNLNIIVEYRKPLEISISKGQTSDGEGMNDYKSRKLP